MLPLKKNIAISPSDISQLIETHYASIMKSFYELQSSFLCGVYKKYGSIETANIVQCFIKNIHLEIIRQREKDLNFNVSLENFWKNFSSINAPFEKITSIVKNTGIPKETVRRKIKKLTKIGLLENNTKNKSYIWNPKQLEKDMFNNIIQTESKSLSKFIVKIITDLDIKTNGKDCCCLVEEEIHSQFSFYWYHYLSCQLAWLKWWQIKLKDNELLLIALQATIPTLQFIEKEKKKINVRDVFKTIGKVNKIESNSFSINASSVAEITGIARATSIRKLNKLVSLGFLTRDESTKRYMVNQSTDARTKNIMSSDSVDFTIRNFSEYIAIIVNSLIHNRL